MGKLIKNSLGYNSNLFVYQDKEMFNYSIDTILLGNFVSLTKSSKKILEVGTNNGALAIFISERKQDLKIDAIEIQKRATEIAIKNVALNKKESQINVINDDFIEFAKNKVKTVSFKKYESIVANPPFYKLKNTIKKNMSEQMHIATHEIKLTLEDLIKYSAKLIEQKGYLTIVIPTERLVDAFEHMRGYGFEPKRIQMIFPREDVKSNLVLVEARYKAGWGVHFLPNIYLHSKDKKIHEYRKEVIELYKPIKVKRGEDV